MARLATTVAILIRMLVPLRTLRETCLRFLARGYCVLSMLSYDIHTFLLWFRNDGHLSPGFQRPNTGIFVSYSNGWGSKGLRHVVATGASYFSSSGYPTKP